MAMFLEAYIANGFADDCDELIHQCLKDTPVTYSGFCKVFRSMQMSCVFHDRISGAEIAELSEELINVAKYYMVANTSNFEYSVVGLFLVYALTKLQPFENFAYLRVAEEDVPFIERIELVARREVRLDVLYVLGRVLTENTRFHAANRERGMEESYRKYLENFTALDNIGQRPKGVFLRQNEELDIIKELGQLQLRYDAAKVTAGVADLKYSDEKFASELNSSLRKIVTGILDDEKVDTESGKEKDVEESARSIKERAMKIKVDPMRHLIAVHDRSPKKVNNPHVSDLKTASGKVKSGGPSNPVYSNTPKQAITHSKTQARAKKRKRSDKSDTRDESDESVELSDHDSEVDIDVDNFTEEQPTSINVDTIQESTEIELDGRDLNLEDLPCFITNNSDGQSYEIEIIDQYKKAGRSSAVTPERRAAFNHEFHRKEKRDLKKTILKSRFKRMGMEPIANFKET